MKFLKLVFPIMEESWYNVRHSMPTIKDVAREAGVSIATVSRVINKSRPVKTEAKESVEKALRKLNYHPNIAARNLVKKRETHPSICVLFPDVITTFFSEVIKGLRDALKKKDYNLLLFDGSTNYKEMVPTLALEGNPGVIVLCRDLPKEEKAMLQRHGIEWILVDSYSEKDHCIYVDHTYGGRLAADHLHSMGSIKPLIISIELTKDSQHWERIKGFQERWKIHRGAKAQLIQVEPATSPGDFMHKGYSATQRALKEKNWDGFFYFCDELAYGGVTAQKEQGTCLPIVGYDGFEATLYQGLPTVAQPIRDLGYAGGMLMVDLLEGKANKSKPIQMAFKPELIQSKWSINR